MCTPMISGEKFLTAILALVAVVLWLGSCTVVSGSTPGFSYTKKPLVVWGHFAPRYPYGSGWQYIPTKYAILPTLPRAQIDFTKPVPEVLAR